MPLDVAYVKARESGWTLIDQTSMNEVWKAVDEQLASHGLEVVLAESDDTACWLQIVKRTP